MSNNVFPTLLGLEPKVSRIPMFRTRVQQGVSGDEVRTAYQAFPLWKFKLKFEFLRDDAPNNELNKILALFMVARGQFDNFLFTDTDRSAVVDERFGTGDGVTTQFQLTRSSSDGALSFVEPVQNVNVLTNIKKAGVAQTSPTNYSISATGLVTFTAAPAAAAALTWTGTYYNRVRFMMDEANFERFMFQLWQLGTCDLLGAPGNKV